MSNKIGDRISLLTIPAVKAENSGVYSCIGTNLAGKSNYSTRLLVNGSFYVSFFVYLNFILQFFLI